MSRPRVMVVEDDDRLRRALRGTLRASGIDVTEAASGEEALALLSETSPDALVLDLMLPGIDGVETLRHLRLFSNAPVIVLTVRDDIDDKVTALDAGADDYMSKPFEPSELLARMRAHLRRTASSASDISVFRAGGLEVNLGARTVTRDGARVALSPLELRLLQTLLENRGRLLTHQELLDAVWGADSEQRTRLRATVVSLRRKLGDDADAPQMIFTEPGIGYRWISESEAS